MKPLWPGNPVTAPLPPERVGFRRRRGGRAVGKVVDLFRPRARPRAQEVRDEMRREATLRRSRIRWGVLLVAWAAVAALFVLIPFSRFSFPHFVLLVAGVAAWFAVFSLRTAVRLVAGTILLGVAGVFLALGLPPAPSAALAAAALGTLVLARGGSLNGG